MNKKTSFTLIEVFGAIAIIAIVAVLVWIVGCSEKDRDEAIDRASKAAKSLNGSDKSAEQEHETPLIVQEEQRKERMRQNMEWTPENQKRFPIEYCQAQLKELETYGQKLDVTAHKIAVELNKVQRNIVNNAGEHEQLKIFLDKAKAAYREAETTGKWPVTINGFQLTRERMRQKIVETTHRIKELQGGAMTPANQKTKLQAKLDRVRQEQRRVVMLQERVQQTINDIRTQQVIEGSDGISAAIDAISDSMGALGVDNDDPSLMDLSKPSSQATVDEEFEAIMRE